MIACESNVTDNASVVESALFCDESLSGAYKVSNSKIETPVLYYYIDDKRIDAEMIQSTASEYSYHSKIKVERTLSKYRCDVIVQTEKVDGLGGILGKAWYPKDIFVRGKNPRPFILDEEDFFGKGEKLWKQYNVLLHEWGHIFGIRHSMLKIAVLYEKYKHDIDGLSIDDVLAIRDHYDVHEDFTHKGKEYYFVHENDTRYLTKNFQAFEFASKCSDMKDGSYIAKDLVTVCQRIRDIYGITEVNSSFRSEGCNIAAKGVSQSAHQLAQALDIGLAIPGALDKFRNDISNKDCIYFMLQEYGVNSIIVYSNHVHLDVRIRASTWVNLDAGYSNYEI